MLSKKEKSHGIHRIAVLHVFQNLLSFVESPDLNVKADNLDINFPVVRIVRKSILEYGLRFIKVTSRPVEVTQRKQRVFIFGIDLASVKKSLFGFRVIRLQRFGCAETDECRSILGIQAYCLFEQLGRCAVILQSDRSIPRQDQRSHIVRLLRQNVLSYLTSPLEE